MPVTNYIWDRASSNVLSEVDDTGATIAEYTNEPGKFGELICQRRDSTNSFFHFDAQRSTRQLTSGNESVTDTYEYSAFGETVSSSGLTENPFRYNGAVGYHTDSGTRDLYVRRRTYKPAVARWLSTDPLILIDGPNAYCYVNNQPLDNNDPSGLLRTVATANRNVGELACGDKAHQDFRFYFDPTLDRPTPSAFCTGVMVQQNEITCVVQNQCTGEYEEEELVFWEAWRVPKQNIKYESILDPVFFTAPPDNTKKSRGVLKVRGLIKYFCNDHNNDAVQAENPDIRGWRTTRSWETKCGTIHTQGVRATQRRPDWFFQAVSQRPTTRIFKVCWRCCDCRDDLVMAQAIPQYGISFLSSIEGEGRDPEISCGQ